MVQSAAALHQMLEGFDFPRMKVVSEASIDAADAYEVDARYRPGKAAAIRPGDGRATVASSGFAVPAARRKTFRREIAHDHLLSDVEVLDWIRKEVMDSYRWR